MRPGRAGLVLVTGEAGIGKTALLTRFATEVAGRGATVVWGTCWDGDQAPAWWPWTQALRALLELRDGLADAVRPELAAIVPELGPAPAAADAGTAGRVQVFDAAWQMLRRAAADTPLVVVLDDLHWADQSTIDLLRFVAQQHQAGPLLLVGAYRPREPRPEIAAALSDLAIAADLVPLRGLSPGEVDDLVQSVTGADELPPVGPAGARTQRWPSLLRPRAVPPAGRDRHRDRGA